jgi:tetratricopeptide (TPR) repeat protein
MRLFGACTVIVVLVAIGPIGTIGTGRADEAQEERAKQLYRVGRTAYNDGRYQAAYDAFKESFRLSHQPALLYNVASALQGLRRPHDAAEALRSFLRLQPNDPDKPQIEERIRTLEEEQRLLDLERKPPPPVPSAPRPAGQLPAAAPAAASASTPSLELTASRPAPADHHRRNAVIIGVTVGGAVVIAAVAIGLAFGLSASSQPLTPATLGPFKGTP